MSNIQKNKRLRFLRNINQLLISMKFSEHQVKEMSTELTIQICIEEKNRI